MKKKINQTTGLIHGVFDIIHYGHIIHFKEAKSKVDYLIVSVTSDSFVNKGPGKPIFNLNKRIEVLNSISYIDRVIVSDSHNAVKNINFIKPDFFIKGKDYKNLKDDLSKQILIEKKAVEKNGGKIIFTETELHSSSSIANEIFEYINQDIKNILNKINKKSFANNFFKFVQKKLNHKILIVGDPIIDVMRFVEPSGKSNKSNILSTQYIKEEINGGGIILVANFLSLFCINVSILVSTNNENLRIIRKKLNKEVKIIHVKTKNKLIKKIRYVDNYSNTRLFQNSLNEKDRFSENEEKKIINKINFIENKYDEILLFDFGYTYSNKNIISVLKNISKKLTINCQSNSYNFGYNLANKYQSGKIISMDEAEFRLVVRNKDDDLFHLIKNNLKIFKKFNNLIITQGKKGCFFIKNEKVIHVPCIIKSSIDSTGSGDIFLSMFFISCISKQFSDIESIISAHVAAGLHSNQLGNRFKINKFDINKIISSITK